MTIDGARDVSLAYESDLSSAISSQLPAAIDAARPANPLPLERLLFLDALITRPAGNDINSSLLLATNCGDGPFPWEPERHRRRSARRR